MWIEWYNALHRITAEMARSAHNLTDEQYHRIAEELIRIAREMKQKK
jgi:hypothetical protein